MKTIINYSKFVFIKIEIKLILLVIIIQISNEIECNISLPIRKADNQCYLTYCTEEEFKMGNCIIDNDIVKIQWLNDIIKVGDKSYKYICLSTSSKNDLFLHTTPKNSDTKNYFFGLKSDGSPYFKINGNYSSIIDITYETSDKTRTNGEIINLIINNKPEKEYLMSVGKTNNNIELFDFEENKVIILSSFEDLTGYTIIAKSFTLFNFMDNNNNYYSILSFIGKENSNYFFVLQKF
jgi:hypothetical protein